ncbi:MalY/PatB family protein [Thalassiella azotivora]
MIVDLPEHELRARRCVKWDVVEAHVLPAWVAETDYALCPEVEQALQRAVRDGVTGYPPPDRWTALPHALAGFAERHWGWHLDPALTLATGDVMAGVRLVLETLCEPAPVVVPTPAYPPFLEVVPVTGRELVQVPLDPDAGTAALDLGRIEDALRAGARTVLLCQPHNPWGRVFTRAELEGLRDVVVRYGARVVSDEIHAPLVLPGARHVPYLSLEGTAEHAVTVLSASKAFNVPGLKCAQVVAGDATSARALADAPLVANHGLSPLGVVATEVAWNAGDTWLAALVERLDAQRLLWSEQVAALLPRARVRPLEATYLAWLDVRAYAPVQPAHLARRRGRVMVNEGSTFGSGGEGHVRVNLATSRDRLVEVVRRLSAAFELDATA